MAGNSAKSSEKKTRRGPGRPFKKNGPAGEKDPRINRTGRPKSHKEFTENVRVELEPLAMEALKLQLADPNPFVVQGAIKEILNRSRGRAPQPLTGEGGEGNPKMDVEGAELLLALQRMVSSPTTPPEAPPDPTSDTAEAEPEP